ncbi:transketolase [Helicobacter sp. MIT 05-5293]|uniref:transketolase n=1 Tax=Helicobacter sp. MIT 05-5293 TaxID=1548149 RepID=UPI0006892857|nr:transketolase [Helicobacter sp. MIT 05-5293]TLD81874.1 transketolase [Helicobacter sp. MIT 05-5293]
MPRDLPKITLEDTAILQKMSHTLRFLCADMVQEANSGHPGAPMGLADIATVLSFHLHLSPKNPQWLNRDRLIFSGGHASALLYALLHLWGFDVSMQDLRSFRQIHSKTPGHPEYRHTQGVEITTGPLGQGVANAVGMAMASKYAQNLYGREIFDHKVYCLCGDGDLQEGISYEAASLAGHHKLSNLILIYDSNRITIEGDTSVAMSEDIVKRFSAQGWNVLECDGHHFVEIHDTLMQAYESVLPTIIIAHTTIAKNALSMEGSHKAHGAPLGEELILKAKEALGLSQEKFFVPEDVAFRFGMMKENGELWYQQWHKNYENLPQITKERFDAMQSPDFSRIVYPQFKVGESLATRVSNGKILNSISQAIEGFIGGSADLAPSNNTQLNDEGDFPQGKNWHFGIREHAMAAICNGVANFGLFLPFCATFFVFSDYMSPSVRVASLMKTRVYYIWTHDSIGVGEDGATHQPIEQLSHFRAMPNLKVFRPADANENIACWQIALESHTPCAFVLSRQNLPVVAEYSSSLKEQIQKGGYLLKSCENPHITLMASGSEVDLSLRSAYELDKLGIKTQVISVPCFDLLLEQPKEYIKTMCKDSQVIAIEASRGLEWYAFADKVIGMQGFGASGKGDQLFEHFGFSVSRIVKEASDQVSCE